MPDSRHAAAGALPFVAGLLLALAGPAIAGLTVQIVQPETDPFTSKVGNPAFLSAVAYVDGQELPGGEVAWEWDFGDQTTPATTNPTTHTWTEAGQYLVTVTATHAGQQGQDTATAAVEEAEPSPAGGTLSIYVARDGTWMNHKTQEYEEAEIEDFVAVFVPPEPINDDPEVWGEHQINDPQIPAGWFFFEAAAPMELHVVIRDTGNRLGEVVVVDRDALTMVGTLEADVLGSEIDGSLAVDPETESFALNIKDTEGTTLALAAADKQEVDAVVAVMHVYGFEANSGDEHAPCPGDRQAPWGNPYDTDGKQSLPDGAPPPTRTVCCGHNDFTNDAQTVGDERPQYKLYSTKRLRDDTRLDEHLMPAASQVVADKITAAQNVFPTTGTLIHQPYAPPPFSQGTVHFLASAEGAVASVVYVAYQSKTSTKLTVGPLIHAQIMQAAPLGGASTDPALSWSAGVQFSLTQKTDWRVVGGGRSAGNVWGATAGTATAVLQGLTGIISPVAFRLTADIPGGGISGTGSVEVGEAWTTPSPPGFPGLTELPLTFDAQGQAQADLAKGFKWTVEAQPTMHYDKPSAQFNAPPTGTVELLAHLQVLLCLKVQCVRGDTACQGYVELERKPEGGEYGMCQSGQSQEQPNGDQIWTTMLLSPGDYRLRVKVPGGTVWSDWETFPVAVGLEATRTVTVPPGE